MRMPCLLCGAHSCMTALLYVPFYNPGGTLSGFTGLLSKGREENQLIRASLVAVGVESGSSGRLGWGAPHRHVQSFKSCASLLRA